MSKNHGFIPDLLRACSLLDPVNQGHLRGSVVTEAETPIARRRNRMVKKVRAMV
jgi:hypothetical protein